MKKSKIIKLIRLAKIRGEVNNIELDITDPKAITSQFDFPYSYIVHTLDNDCVIVSVISGDGDIVADQLPVNLTSLRKRPLLKILNKLIVDY